nr:right-handed parallel beta-helix repeat-containing protein [Sphingomonas sp. S2M10]
MGATIETLFSDDGTSGLYVGGVDATSYVERFQISNVRVTGNGCGAGIQVRHAKRFVVDSCIVHDRIAGSTPDPNNDSQNGIELVNCANFALANCEINNLRTRLGGTPTSKWTRGFTFVECRDGAITGCVAVGCDQNYDFSGAYVSSLGWTGNQRLVVSGCVSANAGTYGFKFANVTRDCLVTGCLAANSGRIGFVFSPSNVALPSGLEKLNTQNIDVVGCKVVNVLGTSWAGAGAEGFRLMSNPTYPNWPQGIRLKACHVADSQDVATTLTAYSSDVVPLEYPAAYVPSYITECTADASVANFTTSDFGKNAAVATGSGALTIANSAWADVTFDLDVIDPQALHSVTSNTQRIYVRDTGWYDVQALIRFAMNGTGLRQARIKKNNVVIDRTAVSVAGSAVSPSSLILSAYEFARMGDYFSVEVFQNSGGDLSLQANESRFTVRAA